MEILCLHHALLKLGYFRLYHRAFMYAFDACGTDLAEEVVWKRWCGILLRIEDRITCLLLGAITSERMPQLK